MENRILIVDEDVSTCEILKFNLEAEGYKVIICPSTLEALKLDLPSFSLIIIDAMMKNIDGYEFTKKIRSNSATRLIPVIFCSTLNNEEARIKGFKVGGDDFITIPFRIREVVARIKSLLRRTEMLLNYASFVANNDKPDLKFKGLAINKKNKICTIDGNPVKITKTEYELLVLFLSNPNIIFTRKEIVNNIWGNTDEVTERAIDTNITRLRKKIGKYGAYLATRLGYGYGFQEKI